MDNKTTSPEVSSKSPTQSTSVVKTVTSKTVDKILSSNDPMEYIKEAKVDLVKLYQELNSIALTAEVMAKDRDGDPVSLGADNRARISAIALLLELAKHLKDKTAIQSIAIVNDVDIKSEVKRLRNLKGI